MRRIMMSIGCSLVFCGSTLLAAQEKAPVQADAKPVQAPEGKAVQAPEGRPVQGPSQKVAPVQAPTQKLEPVQKDSGPYQKMAMQKPHQSPVQKGGYADHGRRHGRHGRHR